MDKREQLRQEIQDTIEDHRPGQQFRHEFAPDDYAWTRTLRVHALQEAVKLITSDPNVNGIQIAMNVASGDSSVMVPLVKAFEHYLQTGEFKEGEGVGQDS